MTSRRTALIALTMAVTACHKSPPSLGTGASGPPEPSGCFVQVWAETNYRGATEFINGPANLETLTRLPGGQDWSGRIRSARVGARALPTVWTEERYGGRTWRMDSREYGVLPDGFAGEIKSMRIQCSTPEK